MDFYDIPAIQAMIRYHHSKLQAYIWRPFNLGLLILDLFQIIIQMVLVNNLIAIVANGSGQEDGPPTLVELGENLDDNEEQQAYIVYDDSDETKNQMTWQLIFSGFQVILIG
jgi:hypothetical protein